MIYFVLLSDCCIFANSMNIPEDFELYTRRLIGDDEYKSLADALATESPVSIRLNPAKSHFKLFQMVQVTSFGLMKNKTH